MRALRIPATIALTTGPQAEMFTGKAAVDGPLTADMVREMATGGIDFQRSSVTPADLSRMDDAQVRREPTETRATIEELTGRPVDTYSLPGTTRHTRVLVRISRVLGYRGIHTPFIGAMAPGSDPMMVWRIMVERSFDIGAFWANLRPAPILRRKLISHSKQLPPHILGPRLRLAIRAYLCESRLAFSLTVRGLTVPVSLAIVVIILLVWWTVS